MKYSVRCFVTLCIIKEVDLTDKELNEINNGLDECNDAYFMTKNSKDKPIMNPAYGILCDKLNLSDDVDVLEDVSITTIE